MDVTEILKELNFKAIRSSGAVGQHVNKTSSKIELTFDLEKSLAFSDEEKALLQKNLSTKLTKENTFILFCEETRSQHRNKELAIKRFLELIKKNLVVPKKRKKSKPSKNSIKKRLDSKQKNSVKKALRKRPKLD